MMPHSARVLFVAPDTMLLDMFREAVLPDSNILAIEGRRFSSEELVDFAHAAGVDVIIARARRVEDLRRRLADIAVLELNVTGGDLLTALEKARTLSLDVAVVAHRSMLEGVDRLAQVLGIRLRLVHSFEPGSLLNGIFLAQEKRAKVIVGDAAVVRACQENNIPCVPIASNPDTLRYVAGQALDLAHAIVFQRENKLLHQAISPRSVPEARTLFTRDDIKGNSLNIIDARQRLVRYAQTDASVLITGETGVGKELFAQGIHVAGPRHDQPFVAVNMPSLPRNLVESELFGYVRGAFTDARREGKPGLFAQAAGGTLFLDEIAEIEPDIQARLLRVLQSGTYTRLGDTKEIEAHCRIIAATNRDLLTEVRQGRFRADLYYRLNVLPLHIDPLRERREDIPFLVSSLLAKLALRYNLTVPVLERESLRLIMDYGWPGNVRELEAVLERLLVLGYSEVILPEHIRAEIGNGLETQTEGNVFFRMTARRLYEEVCACGGNQSLAASRLGIHRSTLWRKLKDYRPEEAGDEYPGYGSDRSGQP